MTEPIKLRVSLDTAHIDRLREAAIATLQGAQQLLEAIDAMAPDAAKVEPKRAEG